MDAQSALALFSKELLSYDTHVGQNDKFYYSLPYERNYELTNSIPIAPVSGNIIKFYQYRIDKPVIIFTDVVDTTAQPAGETEDEELFDENDELPEDEALYDEDGNPRELSEDEMAALLTEDAGDEEEVYDKEPSGAPVQDGFDEEDVYEKEPSDWQPEEF